MFSIIISPCKDKIEKEIYFFILQKDVNFTFEGVYNQIILLCEDGIDKEMVRNALMDCLDVLLSDGIIKYYNGFFYRVLTDNVECSN